MTDMIGKHFVCAVNTCSITLTIKDGPDGTEWQNPEALSLNKEQPRAYLFPFANEEEALKVLPEGSSYYQSLDGMWKFHWVATPEKRPTDFYQPDYDVTNWDDIKVPGCWNVQGQRLWVLPLRTVRSILYTIQETL